MRRLQTMKIQAQKTPHVLSLARAKETTESGLGYADHPHYLGNALDRKSHVSHHTLRRGKKQANPTRTATFFQKVQEAEMEQG